MKILFNRQQIAQQAERSAQDLRDAAQRQGFAVTDYVILICMDGALHFAHDVLRELGKQCDCSFETYSIKLSSYEGTTSTRLKVDYFPSNLQLQGRHILILEDIVDTGQTLRLLDKELVSHQVASIDYCVFCQRGKLLENRIPRPVTNHPLVIEDDAFAVGYGLDVDHKYRYLDQVYEWGQ